jgi:hypothetical protein
VVTREQLFNGFKGCTNGNCIIVNKKKGMHTNGSCQCFLKLSRTQLIILQSRLRVLLNELEKKEEENE